MMPKQFRVRIRADLPLPRKYGLQRNRVVVATLLEPDGGSSPPWEVMGDTGEAVRLWPKEIEVLDRYGEGQDGPAQ